ncbi:hypothetical protein ACSBR2_036098 [Camellia fascicularis]
MAIATALIFFLVILSASLHLHTNTVQAQQRRQSNITLGSTLTPTTNSSWLSVSGLYAFGFYPEGNGYAVGVFLAGILEKTVVWTANRDNAPVPSNATLVLTSDGRLVLQQPQSQDTVITDLTQPASYASMLDSGNFVLYNYIHNIIWQSFDNPTDTILPSQILLAGQELFSRASETNYSTGIFRLSMQHDGHLVQYPISAPSYSGPYSYWASGTNGRGDNCSLLLDGDGHLYLLDATGANIKNLSDAEPTKEEKNYRMTVDVDGIFRVYSLRRTLDPKEKWSIWWNSSSDKCAPKGLCGLNGFCISNDTEADCRCVPGFASVNPSSWASGCVRNFTAESCKIKNEDGNTKYYKMSPLENTQWEDDSYSVLQLSSRKECEDACLQDCNCEAALYKDQQCKKQRLPLRFGRRLPSDSNVAFIKVGVSFSLVDNPTHSDNPPKKPKKDFPIIGVSLVVFSLMILAISGVLMYRNHVWAYKKISGQRNVELAEEAALRTFTFAELEQVTNGFNQELGRGAFGTVFKGFISDNQKDVAVKRLDKVLTEGEQEFQTEIRVIGRTHHRNLVRLIGYCLEGPNRLLVYECMSNGSLADFLFTPEIENRPDWDERIGIALDIARGMLYLHEECESQIIHCDIKPQNILIGGHGCAKISDFGLAKLLKPNQTKTFTMIRGTRGYAAPEWHRKSPVTVKVDVYSFGVMLLEIICCRKCLELSFSEEEIVLEEWVYDCFQTKELGKLVGNEDVDMRKLERMVKVGLWCIQDEPSLRPSMKKVLLMLEGTVDIPIPPIPTSFLSAI